MNFSVKDLKRYLFFWLGLVLIVFLGWFLRGRLSSEEWFPVIAFFLGGLGSGVFLLFPVIPWQKMGFRLIFFIFSFWLLISTPVSFSWGMVLGIYSYLLKEDFLLYKKDKNYWQEKILSIYGDIFSPQVCLGILSFGEVVLLFLVLTS